MEIVPLGPGFAAELRGVTLADVAADDAVYAGGARRFRRALGSGVPRATGRRRGPDSLSRAASARRKSPMSARSAPAPHFVILTTIGPDGKVVPEDHRYRHAQQGQSALAYRLVV